VEREVRYCETADGVRLAYQVEGEGPVLVVCPLFVESFSMAGVSVDLQAHYEMLGRGQRLIQFDMRGTGLSQREVKDISPLSTVLDLAAVVEAAGVEKCSIYAHGEAGPRAIRYAAEHPDRVASLVLWGTYVRPADVATSEQIGVMAALCRENWPVAAQTIAGLAGVDADGGHELASLAKLYRRSADGPTAARILEAAYSPRSDVSELLKDVTAKTLVLHRVADRVYPFRGGQEIAEGISGARLVSLEGRSGTPLNGPNGAEEIDRFLREHHCRSARVMRMQRSGKLTRREVDVLRLIAAGKTSGEVSRELCLSIRTVGRHITNIYTKIGAKGRSDATAYALRHRIAGPTPVISSR
jgi:pimeloyl-ACP methyl ester carboxylesterase/DNA-binding CsgD family transcriptional regulator